MTDERQVETREVRLTMDELWYLKDEIRKLAHKERKRVQRYIDNGTTNVKPNMYDAAVRDAQTAERLYEAFTHNYETMSRQKRDRIVASIERSQQRQQEEQHERSDDFDRGLGEIDAGGE